MLKRIRRLVQRVLQANGYRVVAADDADSAKRACDCQPERFQILLTDVVMPGMTGMELAVTLAQINPNLKVLFMSGYADEVISEQGGILEGFHRIAKPFTPSSLTRKLREVAESF
jgi:DNA-binding NtrC family response regulator